MGADGHLGLPLGQLPQSLPALPDGEAAGKKDTGDPQLLQQRSKALVVLLRQNFRGGHQGRLAAIADSTHYGGGSHHGLAGAHVSLDQPVHRPAGSKILHDIPDGPALCPGEGERQRLIKGRQIRIPKGLTLQSVPPPAQLLQADGQQEQLLEHQPPPGVRQLLLISGEVDLLIGIAGVAQAVGGTDLVRQGICQQIPAFRQPLLHRPDQRQLADTGGEGVDGHDSAGKLPLALLLHHRVGHGLPQEVSLRLAVKNIGFSGDEAVFPIGLVEKGNIQGAALIHRPELHQLQALADPAEGGRSSYHGLRAGVLPVLEILDFHYRPAVIVCPGKIGDQILEGTDPQLGQGLGFLFPDALDIPHVGAQIRHGPFPPLRCYLLSWLMYSINW